MQIKTFEVFFSIYGTKLRRKIKAYDSESAGQIIHKNITIDKVVEVMDEKETTPKKGIDDDFMDYFNNLINKI